MVGLGRRGTAARAPRDAGREREGHHPMTRRSPAAGMARMEERIVNLAEVQERALLARLDAATAGPGVGQQHRPQREADELIASEDPEMLARLRAAAPFMTPAERAQA